MAKELQDIFTQTDCLSLDALYGYAENSLSTSQLHLVENHLIDCQLCAATVEDMQLPDRTEVEAVNRSVQQRVYRIVGKAPTGTSMWLRVGIAAAIAAVVAGTIVMWPDDKPIEKDITEEAAIEDKHEALENPSLVTPLETKPELIAMSDSVNDEFNSAVRLEITQNGIAQKEEVEYIKPDDENPLEVSPEGVEQPYLAEKEPVYAKDIHEMDENIPESLGVRAADLAMGTVEVLSRFPLKNHGHLSTEQRIKRGNAYMSILDQKGHVDITTPEFIGGEDRFKEYIQENIKFPAGEEYEGKGRTAVVSFIINKKGYVTEVELQNTLGEHIDKELFRVLSEMPKWKPSGQKGKKGKVRYTIAVAF